MGRDPARAKDCKSCLERKSLRLSTHGDLRTACRAGLRNPGVAKERIGGRGFITGSARTKSEDFGVMRIPATPQRNSQVVAVATAVLAG